MNKTSSQRKWWKEGIVYQIYPRSFQDSNHDGIGDLRGIITRLDYIKSLGVDIIWLNPIYQSPNDDNGYDISDYYSIMDEFGTMADFDELLAGLHQRGLKLVMDLVVNHSSDEHKWFQDSRRSRSSPYRGYYHWWPAEKGTPPKRWSYFDEDGNAWNYDEQTDSYYLHYFSVKQPDLNWENPSLRQDIYKMMRYWFDKGVDGFRMDVISFLSKDTSFPPIPARYHGDYISFYADGPKLHDYLQEMNREVLSHYDVMTVGEAPGVTLDKALDFVDEERRELHMFFHFDLMGLDRDPEQLFLKRKEGWKLLEFKKVFSDWDTVFAKKGWGSLFLGNHDFPRAVSRWGDDREEYWYPSATLLHTFLLSMRGTPYIYFGDEIGMTNIRFSQIEDYKDINTINLYRQLLKQGRDMKFFLEDQKETSRDNARTPMQWDDSLNAGFTTGTPWIKINPNFRKNVNVKAQENHPPSILNYFRKMTALRKEHLGLVYGAYTLLQEKDPNIYSYLRSWEGTNYWVALNFSTNEVVAELPNKWTKESFKLLINNYEDSPRRKGSGLLLKPYQAIVVLREL